MALQPGQLFAGKYRVERVLGIGGFATVFSALFEEIGRPVAIKVLTPERDGTYPERLTQRFLREARLISELTNPHTVTLYDFGRHDDLLYMVFEFVRGEPLDALITRGPMAPTAAVECIIQVLESLEEAHQSGILHRDIKPANLMASPLEDGSLSIKVLDFGIAKAIPGGDRPKNETITVQGTFVGTLPYVSPEQITQAKLTPAADIYSTGLVAFELLTGERAIGASSKAELIRAQVSLEEIAWPLPARVDSTLQQIIGQMIRKNPAERFQSTAEALASLREWTPGMTPIPTRDFSATTEVDLEPLPPSLSLQGDRSIDPNLEGLGVDASDRLDRVGYAAPLPDTVCTSQNAFKDPVDGVTEFRVTDAIRDAPMPHTGRVAALNPEQVEAYPHKSIHDANDAVPSTEKVQTAGSSVPDHEPTQPAQADPVSSDDSNRLPKRALWVAAVLLVVSMVVYAMQERGFAPEVDTLTGEEWEAYKKEKLELELLEESGRTDPARPESPSPEVKPIKKKSAKPKARPKPSKAKETQIDLWDSKSKEDDAPFEIENKK